MKYLLALSSVLLAACSEPTFDSACFSNGDHENMSDGRITRICDCMEKRVAEGNPTPKQSKWLIAMLRKKDITDATEADKTTLRQTSTLLSWAQEQCQVK